MLWSRGIFCIFCRSRRGRDRCGQLLRRRGQAWALRLALGRSDTANLFVGGAGYRGLRSTGRASWKTRLLRFWPDLHLVGMPFGLLHLDVEEVADGFVV